MNVWGNPGSSYVLVVRRILLHGLLSRQDVQGFILVQDPFAVHLFLLLSSSKTTKNRLKNRVSVFLICSKQQIEKTFASTRHSVVKARIASMSCARRFLCNFYTKIASENWSHPQLNPKFSRFWDIWYFLTFFKIFSPIFPLFCSKMACYQCFW